MRTTVSYSAFSLFLRALLHDITAFRKHTRFARFSDLIPNESGYGPPFEILSAFGPGVASGNTNIISSKYRQHVSRDGSNVLADNSSFRIRLQIDSHYFSSQWSR